MGPPQHRFLLVLFSGLPDIVPWPGIETARLKLSDDKVYNIVQNISCFVHLQCQRRLMDNIVSESSMIYSPYYMTTDLRRLQQPHFAQSFPPWAVEDRLHQEVAQ